MTSQNKSVADSREFRELSDGELNEMMGAFGDLVRAQTIDQKKKLKADLRREIDSAHASFISDDKKNY